MSQTTRLTFLDAFESHRVTSECHPLRGKLYVVPRGVDARRGAVAYLYPDGMVRSIAVHEGVYAYYDSESEIEAAYQNHLKLMQGDA